MQNVPFRYKNKNKNINLKTNYNGKAKKMIDVLQFCAAMHTLL
jgi:hypothetical protein